MAKRKRVNITRGHSNLHVQPQAEQQESEFKQHLQFENDQHEEENQDERVTHDAHPEDQCAIGPILVATESNGTKLDEPCCSKAKSSPKSMAEKGKGICDGNYGNSKGSSWGGDLYSQVERPAKTGRVHCVGMTPSLQRVNPSLSYSHQHDEEIGGEIERLDEDIERLKADIRILKEVVRGVLQLISNRMPNANPELLSRLSRMINEGEVPDADANNASNNLLNANP
ncbi:uncharacterized protein LOC110807334 [Carica papaya]|uniref:uncharacterized protein LOC110807334 n=1 Tax=Carica papaya TaxID=3649 RepID=UPI000B8C8DA5|nr:uncharacterized protein LOC110807334 [Carica papaya]XP_021888139.1 uncharacterized protein LOC110807334 [Carica papaya]XP_021888140.1 uncharacterized protein LOC110807334 [Carica papaya]XP_021888141.1 uncharacterized protein LOC110807334 [Carica papaya]XP_021888142.1 uncharacterized protein LOC110807334 [Carica papaya]XP_021888143.1 uncharacterized protein LOC110807334 [Carica papaya]XP_021888144.1 uncharacterized protein LOC110807334 [Carica papaya]XP_021888145.1 uncharacterized protein 